MYRIKDIQYGLRNLVGFEQDLNPANKISDDLTTSESGVYFQAAHPMVTISNIKKNMPVELYAEYEEWDPTKQYALHVYVKHNGMIWYSMAPSINSEPSNLNPDWIPYNILSIFLRSAVNDGIATMVQRFVREKMLDKVAPSIIERKMFFDGAGRMYDTITSSDSIVGFELVPRRAMGVVTKINRIGLQFYGGNAFLNVYLFNSNVSKPIATQRLIVVGDGSLKWYNLNDWNLAYSGTNTAGGSWFVVYDQSELSAGMEAINSGMDFSRSPRQTCCGSIGKFENYKQITQNLEFYPFSNREAFTTQMWDITRNIYPGCINYGMNLEVTVGCDLTDFIISQRDNFADCLQKQVAANLMRRMAFNPDDRINNSQLKIAPERIAYEVDGEPGRESIFAKELKEAYKALDLNTRGIDKVCLPCKNRGIRYTNA